MAAPSTGSASDRRRRRRLRDMQQVQRHALALFDQHGFDAVSVEQVAQAAEVSPVSIYRWFGTKERLVLWDDYDPALLAAVESALVDHPPLEAVCRAVVSELDAVYDTDRELVLARTKLIYREPALLAAARDDARQLETALRGVLAAAGVGDTDLARAVLAGCAVSALIAAVEAWQADDGRTSLAVLVSDGFDVVIGTPR